MNSKMQEALLWGQSSHTSLEGAHGRYDRVVIDMVPPRSYNPPTPNPASNVPHAVQLARDSKIGHGPTCPVGINWTRIQLLRDQQRPWVTLQPFPQLVGTGSPLYAGTFLKDYVVKKSPSRISMLPIFNYNIGPTG